MRRRYSEIRGMEVLAQTEGKRLGIVRRLHIDSKKKVVSALVFKPSGVGGESWAQVSKVERIGVDVVFLPKLEDAHGEPPPGRDAHNVLGLPVTTLDGRRMGAIHDLVIDVEIWTIAALVLEDGYEVDVGPETVIGEDTVLLAKGAIHQVRSGPPVRTSFLSRVFGSESKRTEVLKPEDFGLSGRKKSDKDKEKKDTP